jgi:hypothetical protein
LQGYRGYTHFAKGNLAIYNGCRHLLGAFSMNPDEGLIAIISDILRMSAMQTKIRLFTGSLVPAHDTILLGVTEATFPGYAPIVATSLTWPTPTINGSAEAESDGPTMTWTASSAPSSPEVITGIYVSIQDGSSSDRLWFAKRFVDSITITDIGDQVQKKLNNFNKNY